MRLPFVISIPHCTFRVPNDIRGAVALTEREIMESTDMGTRELFSHLPVHVILFARWSRIAADLNRDPQRRDAKGVVPTVDYHNRRIYREGLDPEENEIERRLQAYYRPYHGRLREAIESEEIRVLFDCHSLEGVGPPGAPDPFTWRKDIVLSNNGNARGEKDPALGETTCPADALLMMKEVFNQQGFSVSVNQPYTGGYITTHYGGRLRARGKAAVQIEINQNQYLDRQTLHFRIDRLSDILKRLHQVFREIARQM